MAHPRGLSPQILNNQLPIEDGANVSPSLSLFLMKTTYYARSMVRQCSSPSHTLRCVDIRIAETFSHKTSPHNPIQNQSFKSVKEAGCKWQ